ncbi:MAG: hypothetical protein PW786_15385 [Arachidicoccus sp.]|nr:hypothetical protein [Arachidicoccus sp.]
MKTLITYGALLFSMANFTSIASAKNISPIHHHSHIVIQKNIYEVKPQEIIDKYIQAIGGKDNLDKIKTIHSTGNASVQGQELPYETKRMNPNKLLVNVSMNGQTVSKQVFDGIAGYKEQMGNKADYSADEIKKYGEAKGLFPQEFYATAGYALTAKGTTKVNEKAAYIIEVTSPSGIKSTEYYDSVSYLLVRQDVSQNGLDLSIIFDNYKPVNNVLFPYKLTQSISTANGVMEVGIIADSIIVNGNDVADADFK